MFGFGNKKFKLKCYRCEKKFNVSIGMKDVKPSDYDFEEGKYMYHTLTGGGLHGNWMKVSDDKCPFCKVKITKNH